MLVWNFAANDLQDNWQSDHIYHLRIGPEDVYSYYCYWLQHWVMLDYQPKACTPETRRKALMLYDSQSERQHRPGWEGDYNALFTEIGAPIYGYCTPPSINRGWFPKMLSVSKGVRGDLMSEFLRLLHDPVGDYRLIAHLPTSIFCIELAERRLMDPQQLQDEIQRKKSQASANQVASGFSHKIGLELATNLAKTIAPPTGSFCPCILRLLQTIKHGALMLAVVPYGHDTSTLEGLDYFRTLWAEVAVPEFMFYVKRYILPLMPNLKTLKIVVPEIYNSDNGWGHEERNLGRRRGGWPWTSYYVGLEAKIADIEEKIRRIKDNNHSPSVEVDLIKQLRAEEWRLAHDVETLRVIADVLKQWQCNNLSVKVKLDLAIEEYSTPYAYTRWLHYRPANTRTV